MGALHPLHLSVDPSASDPLAGFQASITHKQITNVIGPSGSGKSRLLQRISQELTHQFNWLEQLNCKKPLTAFTPADSDTRVTGGRLFIHISSLAAALKGKKQVKHLLPEQSKKEQTLPSACPNCGKQSVETLFPDSLARLLIQKHSEERCLISALVPCRELSPFPDSDAVLSFLDSVGISGKSYLYVDGTVVDVDDPDDCNTLFPFRATELAVIEERVILRAEQRERLSEVLKITHNSGFPFQIHTSSSYSLSSDHTWLCADCLSSGGLESDRVKLCFKDILTKLPSAVGKVVPESISKLPLDATVSSLPRSSQRALVLLSLVAKDIQSKLVLLDSDILPLQHSVLVEACLQALKANSNTVVFNSRSITHESDAQLSLHAEAYDKQQEYPRSKNFPLKSGRAYRILDSDASLRTAAQQKALFAVVKEDAIASLTSDGDTPVLYHSLQLAPRDKNRTVISIPGLAIEIAKLFAKMSHAKEHGLTAQKFKHLLLNPEDREKSEGNHTRFKGYTINDILNLPAEYVADLFAAIPKCKYPLDCLIAAGLGPLPLSRELTSLSSGEIARYCLARLALSIPKNSVLLVPDLTTVLSPDEFTILLDELVPLVEKSRSTILFGIE